MTREDVVAGCSCAPAQQFIQADAASRRGLIQVFGYSCNPIELTRREWERVAGETGTPYVNIEVVCSDLREHRKRVENRLSTVPGVRMQTWRDVAERQYDDWTVDRVVLDTFGLSERDCLNELLAKMSVPSKLLQPTRAASPNEQRDSQGAAGAAERRR